MKLKTILVGFSLSLLTIGSIFLVNTSEAQATKSKRKRHIPVIKNTAATIYKTGTLVRLSNGQEAIIVGKTARQTGLVLHSIKAETPSHPAAGSMQVAATPVAPTAAAVAGAVQAPVAAPMQGAPMMNPGMMNPGMMNPGMMHPGMMAPGPGMMPNMTPTGMAPPMMEAGMAPGMPMGMPMGGMPMGGEEGFEPIEEGY